MTNSNTRHLRGRLWRKVLLPLGLAAVAVLLLGMLGAMAMLRLQIENRLRDRSESIGSTIANVTENIARLTDLERVVSAMAAEPGINQIILVAGKEPRVIASSQHALLGRKIRDLPGSQLATDIEQALRSRASVVRRNQEKDEFRHVLFVRLALPELAALEPVDGAVMVALDTRAIEADAQRSVFILAGSFMVGLTLVILLASFLMTRHLLKPLASISSQLQVVDADQGEVDPGRSRGDPVGDLVAVLNQAVQARRARELALKVSERRLQHLLTSSPSVIYSCKTSGDYPATFISANVERLTGYTPAQFLEDPAFWAGHLHPEDAPRIFAGLPAVFEHRSHSHEYRFLIRDGSYRWLRDDLQLVTDEAGRPMELVGSWLDITQRKTAEEQLRISEQRHRLIAEHAIDIIWTMGRDRVFTYVSPSIKQLTGHTPEAFARLPLDQVIAPGSLPVALDYFRNLDAAIQAGERAGHFRGEIELWRKDGSAVWTEIMASPVYDEQGRFVELIGVTRDIDRRKRAERLLQDTNLELQQSTARASELAARAEAASRAKSEFLATMSHEIRTPMNGVLGMTELLQLSPLDARQRELADNISRSGKALLEIINNILDLSKIEAGRMVLTETEFELRPLVEGVATLLAQSGHGKPVTLRVECDDAVPGRLRGDAGRLRQVMLNLMGNGLKFTSFGSVVARVRTLENTPENVRLRFEITDTGMGIPAAKSPLLFQPFQQLDSSHARRHGGTGLGLAISQRLVELMGGSIGLESEDGKGSTFWFEIPLAISAASGQPQAETTTAGLRVLVARAHHLNCRLALVSLEKLGCRADAVELGKEILERLRQQPYDAVLFDMQLADMDGFTLAAAVRERRQGGGQAPSGHVRLIGLSAEGIDRNHHRLQEAGIDATLGNSPTLVQLRQALLGASS